MASLPGNKIRVIKGFTNTYYKFATMIYHRIQLGLRGDVLEQMNVGQVAIEGTDTTGTVTIAGATAADVVLFRVDDSGSAATGTVSFALAPMTGVYTFTRTAAPGAGESSTISYAIIRAVPSGDV